MAGETKTFTTEIETATGKVLRTGVAGATTREIPMENVTLAEKRDGVIVHHKLVHVPEFTVIHTKSNPQCQWYFIGGKWIQICV